MGPTSSLEPLKLKEQSKKVSQKDVAEEEEAKGTEQHEKVQGVQGLKGGLQEVRATPRG